MKNAIVALVLTLALMPALSFGSVKVYNTSGQNLGIFNDVKCGYGLGCSKVAGKAVLSQSGALRETYSTSGDLSVSQCGMTITSDNTVSSSGGPIDLFNLPAISSSVLGCRYTFIVGVPALSNQQLQVNPNTADQILLLASSAGDAISADATGESVTIEALPTGWAPVGSEKGTWTDIN